MEKEYKFLNIIEKQKYNDELGSYTRITCVKTELSRLRRRWNIFVNNTA